MSAWPQDEDYFNPDDPLDELGFDAERTEAAYELAAWVAPVPDPATRGLGPLGETFVSRKMKGRL